MTMWRRIGDERVVAGAGLCSRRDGTKRSWLDGIYLAVRAFYLDVHTWSAAEPERWARWVAPSPIRDTDLRQFHIRRRRLSERMANRTRERQPLLPILSQHVNDRWNQLRTVLTDAREATPGQCFVAEGNTWQRAATRTDLEDQDRPGTIRAINRDTGELVHLSQQEDTAFWQWAVVETLRLAGLRIEELCELTHLSVRNYQRPNGEVLALLVVNPSKSDRERVIPMSGELFHVVAQVIRRHIAEHGTVPICVGYDLAERTWSDPTPFLFQHIVSDSRRAMSTRRGREIVSQAVETLIPTHPEFADIKFAPHDFRRLLATDLVNNGLPIHIGAALLGHLDVQTIRGYVAVFPEDIIKHYQQFLEHRRSRRPMGEYRQPTDDEWSEFQEHFDKRRVELGSCGRPYGTPCAHEHACFRCPMLSINPKMLPRLDELEADLLARRQRAITEDWRGEVEGIELTLTFLRAKRNQAQRSMSMAVGSVDLGIPAPR
jgi:site-specific recombinase XerD